MCKYSTATAEYNLLLLQEVAKLFINSIDADDVFGVQSCKLVETPPP